MTPNTVSAPRLSAPLTAHFAARPLVAMAFACALVAPAFAADKAPDHAAQMTLGKQLFTAGAVPACAICHTLKDADAEGAIGPVLDELQPDAARVAKALRAGLGVMPSYAGKLTDAEIKAVATYVAYASGGQK